jgi:hypothetical protein
MPRSLHAELARYAELDGVSLNQFLVTLLAAGIGFRTGLESQTASHDYVG